VNADYFPAALVGGKEGATLMPKSRSGNFLNPMNRM
jgi:hypothetical protein